MRMEVSIETMERKRPLKEFSTICHQMHLLISTHLHFKSQKIQLNLLKAEPLNFVKILACIAIKIKL